MKAELALMWFATLLALILLAGFLWAFFTDSPDRCVNGRTTLSNMPCTEGK